ncbi:hypothetical protein EHS25_009285 [Saitozyma podzolica]|uniref:Uncharacterized protein n=1 Tax=Saitozyma podzolica TaxID=1890683 RepID=A0A427YLE2_9TREE|nr:hypothetical protein EHS25_009285 [Saitozyma podzolica]
MTDIDGVKPNGLGGISTAAAGSSSNSTSTSNTNSNPPGLAATRTTRKPPNCTICGASFKRPKPDPAALALFPPARRARRSKAAYSGAGVGTGSGLPAEDAKDVEGLKGAKHVEGVTAAEDVKGVKRETSSGVVKTAKGVSGGDAPTSRLDLDPGSASSTTSRPSNPTPGADPAATAPPPPPTSSDSSAPPSPSPPAPPLGLFSSPHRVSHTFPPQTQAHRHTHLHPL